MGMRLFDIYRTPNGDYKAVARGFSVWSAIFSPLWSLYHRLWLESAAIVFGFSVIRYVQKTQIDAGMVTADLLTGVFLSHLVLFVVMGACGHEWINARYRRLRYQHEGVMLAFSKRDALSRAKR